MRKLFFLFAMLALRLSAPAASTINNTNAFSYGANMSVSRPERTA
jgi:hypothetical protein